MIQPVSRLAVWSRRIAFFSLAATFDRRHHRALGRARYRAGALDARRRPGACRRRDPAGARRRHRRSGATAPRAARYAIAAFLIGIALIAYPAYLGVKAYRLPAIYDITTDPIDPPQFDAIARLRPRDANPLTYAGLYTAEQQHLAYSDIEPDDTTASPQEAYDAAMKVIAKRRWRVVDARPPQPTGLPAVRGGTQPAIREGIIEAVARTLILGFRDDVVVRVRATPTAHASMCARRRATAITISAAMPSGYAS